MRILTVGGSLPGIEHDHRKWSDQTNIKDYDVSFLNLDNIIDISKDIPGPTSNVEHKIRLPSGDEIKKCLKSGNHIFILLPRTRQPELLHVSNENTIEVDIDLLDWLPFEISTTEEPGSSVLQNSVRQNWRWYFDSDFDWPMYIDRIQLHPEFKRGSLETETQFTIASTTFNQDISCEISIEGGGDLASNLLDADKPAQYPGSVYLLPIRPDWDFEEIVKGILSNIFELSIDFKQESKPNWANNRYLPRQVEISDKIDKLKQEYDDLEQFSRLLYEDDDELEREVHRAFEYLGFETEDEIPGQRDGLVYVNNEIFVLEIEGTKNRIGIKKCRQLDNWVENVQTEYEDANVQGLLVPNADRKNRVSKRVDSIVGEPRKFIQRHGYKVLNSHELYKMIKEYQQDNLTTERIREIFQSDDLLITVPDSR